MIRFRSFLFAALMLLNGHAAAQEFTLAAAADLKFALDEIVAHYRQSHPADTPRVIYGSSGKFATQIRQNAPYDLYFSADIAYPKQLERAGFAASPVRPYALGRIVLWSASLDASKMTLASLNDSKITRIAIANPRHAPYGKRAEEALRATGLWDTVKSKLVYGENIGQTAQFVQTGNAQVGIIALALALNPALSRNGKYWMIPDSLHKPLEQGFIVTARARNNAGAQRFADYMNSAAARAMMVKYGFVLPGEAGAAP